jgi:energy-converting hydrogenase A subunit R
MVKKIFVSDCEGPISKNDNAFEIAAHFVPNGDKLFTLISKYDDILVDVVKKKDYSAGGTLKLILPFLKACNVTDEQMHEFSKQNLIFIADTKDTLCHIMDLTDAFIVSTSYEHYIKALCEVLEFPFENTYCTKLKLDNYIITLQESEKLKELAEEITKMPMMTIPSEAKAISDFSAIDQETIRRLDEIFWTEIVNMSCGKIFFEVVTVGGEQKAQAIRDIVAKLHISAADVMYVGDSITDVEAFQLVRQSGGLAVSFNGNNYAVKNAEIAVLSENSIITAMIADVFCEHGKDAALQLVKSWNRRVLQRSIVNPFLLGQLFALYPKELPKVQIPAASNMEIIVKESSEFRKKVRGQAIGRLG